MGQAVQMGHVPGDGTEWPFLAPRVGFLPKAGVAPTAGGVGLAGAGSAGECRGTAEKGRGRRRRWCGEVCLCARHHVVPEILL